MQFRPESGPSHLISWGNYTRARLRLDLASATLNTMPDDPLLEQALAAIRQQDRRKARELLTRLVKADPKNPRYWLWLSTVVDTSKEAIFCLQETLKYDSNNQTAMRGLISYGVMKTEKSSGENPFQKKIDWTNEVTRRLIPPPPPKPEKKPRKKRPLGVIFGSAGLILLVILGVWLILPNLPRRSKETIIISRPTAKATATYLPTNTPVGYKPSPTPRGQINLQSLLEATYTPTPIYVNTPHPSEAYLLAMRAYERGDLGAFKEYLQQVLAAEPNSADIYYLLGEAERKNGNLNQALVYFEKAMSVDKKFAPAIVSHAEVVLETDPKKDLTKNLDAAVDADPGYVMAYIRRGEYHLLKDRFDLAIQDFNTAIELNPESPLAFLGLAKLYLTRDEPEKSLEYAQKAYALDKTMLDVYLVLGAAYIATGQGEKSIEPLETYLSFKPYDAAAYELVGKAYWAAGEDTKAVENLEKSMSMSSSSFDVYYIRGVTNIKLGRYMDALNDLTKALAINDKSFEAVFQRGMAYHYLKRYHDSYNQFLRAENLATTNKQKVDAIYQQAKTASTGKLDGFARTAWKKLLALPESDVPAVWIQEAKFYLYPCKGDQCLALTATAETKGTAAP